jgi:hypothetical protein
MRMRHAPEAGSVDGRSARQEFHETYRHIDHD